MIAEYLDGYFYNDGQPMTSFSGGVDKVLAPVPSYEEWQASEKYNKHLEEVIKIYERKDKQATETSIAYNELLEENAQLKELLKECKIYIENFIEGSTIINEHHISYILLQRIKEELEK